VTTGEWLFLAVIGYLIGREIVHRLWRSRAKFVAACKALEKASR
jgi:hypothetical protein